MSGLLNKAKDAMGKSGSSSGGAAQSGAGGGQQEYLDKGIAAAEKKTGYSQSAQTNEKITDAGRDMYEKQTGSKVNSKVCAV